MDRMTHFEKLMDRARSSWDEHQPKLTLVTPLYQQIFNEKDYSLVLQQYQAQYQYYQAQYQHWIDMQQKHG